MARRQEHDAHPSRRLGIRESPRRHEHGAETDWGLHDRRCRLHGHPGRRIAGSSRNPQSCSVETLSRLRVE
jgi:hypothetical protein